MGERVAQVAVAGTAYHFDKLFDYAVPDALMESAQAGCRVLVPFGGGNRRRQGMIIGLRNNAEVERIKPIAAVLDEAPLLREEMLSLVQFLHDRTFCTYFDAAKAMLPAGISLRMADRYAPTKALLAADDGTLEDGERAVAGVLCAARGPVEREKLIKALSLSPESDLLERMTGKGLVTCESDPIRRISDATIRMVRLCAEEFSDQKLTQKQRAACEFLQEAGGTDGVSLGELCYFTGVTPAVVGALVKKGIVQYSDEEAYRNPYRDAPPERDEREIVLTGAQQEVYDGLRILLKAGEAKAALLYGVTGSGKTSVFMKLIDRTLARGDGVIVMVPEIALTPQTISLFRARYGERIAVFHSALSLGERLDEWKRVKRGEARIAVGTRSAVFAPFDKIGLIVMDEEQEHTYKSESAPRYHARDVAKFRCMKHRALLLLCSATPSVESFQAAQTGVYTLFTLPDRYGTAQLPDVTVVDLNKDPPVNRSGSISAPLLAALEKNLAAGLQSILLLNRRGYHTYASCRKCGHVLTCPQCSISMTYHAVSGRLLCHYCGHSIAATALCPECGEESVRYTGLGTQRLEEELAGLLPAARVLRLDADTTMSRFAHEKKLALFKSRQYDIMVGTQMVAKGLDFPDVTLVGVLSADQALYSDDFRSYERAFSLLTQVVGRSGRGARKGQAVIQTYTPENPVIRMAATQDYEAFFRSEIQVREALLYPPKADICVIGFVGADHGKVETVSKAFFDRLRGCLAEKYADLPLRILRPMPAAVVKVSGKYRYKMTMKCVNSIRFRACIAEMLALFGKEKQYEDVTVFADMNPEYIL